MLNRIKQYIDSKGISVSAFEKSIGMSNASFGKSLKNNGSIGSDKLENILKIYTDINTDWLLTGKGEMLKDNKGKNFNVSGMAGSIIAGDGNVQMNTTHHGGKETPKPAKVNESKYLQLQKENELLSKEILHLNKIIEEKERLIQVLLNK